MREFLFNSTNIGISLESEAVIFSSQLNVEAMQRMATVGAGVGGSTLFPRVDPSLFESEEFCIG